MKFKCTKTDLLIAINTVQKAISYKNVMPILSCILLKVENKELFLIATDLEMGIKAKVKNVKIEEEGSVALNYRLFSEIVKRFSEEEIQIEVDENNYATITAEKSDYKIAGEPGIEYPDLPVVEKEKSIMMFQNDLRLLIKSTIFSISQEESKQTLTGELFELEDGKVTLVAVDGYRIALRSAVSDHSMKDFSIIIPGKTMNELSKLLSSEKEDRLQIYFTDRHVLFELESSIIVSRLIEGNFIKYKQNFSDNAEIKIRVDKAALLAASERVSLIAALDERQIIKFEITKGKMKISSSTTQGMGQDELSVDYDGEGMRIGFNPKFILDALRNIDDEEIVMTFISPLKQSIILPKEGESFKYLLLPIKIND